MRCVLIKFILIGIIVSVLSGQSFIPADPFNLIKYEQENFILDDNNQSFLLRPILPGSNKKRWGLILRNEFFINDNHPNLENMGNRWLGKGGGYFTGLNISYLTPVLKDIVAFNNSNTLNAYAKYNKLLKILDNPLSQIDENELINISKEFLKK